MLSSQLFVFVPVTILLNRSRVNGTFLPDRDASNEQQDKAFEPKNTWPQEYLADVFADVRENPEGRGVSGRVDL